MQKIMLKEEKKGRKKIYTKRFWETAHQPLS